MSFYQEDDSNQKCLYNVSADTQQFKTFFLHIFLRLQVIRLGTYLNVQEDWNNDTTTEMFKKSRVLNKEPKGL